MLNTEYKDLVTESDNKIDKDYQKTVALFDKGDKTLLDNRVTAKFIRTSSYDFSIEDKTLSELQDVITEVEEFIASDDSHGVAYGEADVKADAGDHWVSDIYLQVPLYYVKTTPDVESIKKAARRHIMNEAITKVSGKSFVNVDCSMLQLFMEGTIDFDALVKITTQSNC